MCGLARCSVGLFMIAALSGFTVILPPPSPIAPVVSPARPTLQTATPADLAAQIQRALPAPEPVSGTLTVRAKHDLEFLATNA